MVDDVRDPRATERDVEARLDELPRFRARERDAEALIAEYGRGAVDAAWHRMTDAGLPEFERRHWAGVSGIVGARLRYIPAF